ncbi:25042_t:CDS:1, partial [Gigaspora margarita]
PNFNQKFNDYITQSFDEVKISTQKSDVALNEFKVDVNYNQNLFNSPIIGKHATIFQLSKWIIQ